MATLTKTSLKTEWPYTIELVPLQKVFADARYQRPPQKPFIDRIVNSFDATLVGVVDLSARRNGMFAILDGLQRIEALHKVSFHGVWACLYEGMTLAEEAMFFYRKNKDRRQVHPFYSFRARGVAGDRAVRDIFRIVESEAYKLGSGASPHDVITAIRAVEEAYSYQSPARTESLSPALHMLRKVWYGRQGGKEGELIRGLGRFFQPFYDEEIDFDGMENRLADENPRAVVGRARDNYHLGQFRSNPVAEEILRLYNRGRKQGKLSRQMLAKTRR